MATTSINAHITRALALSATAIDESWLGLVDAWLDSEAVKSNLLFWANPAFGTNKDGSNIISSVRCLGTTLKPRGRDFTPSTSATTYNATGIGGLPAVSNANANSWGYFGGGQFNTFRRRTGLTLVACYKKTTTHSNAVTPFGFGQNGGFALQVQSGSPGTLNLTASGYGNVWTANAPHGTTLSTSATNIIGGTISASEAIPYVEGVAGTPSACTNAQELFGQLGTGSGNNFLLMVGSTSGKNNASASAVSGTTTFDQSQAQFMWSDLIVFDTVLSPTKMASLNSLLRGRIGP